MRCGTARFTIDRNGYHVSSLDNEYQRLIAEFQRLTDEYQRLGDEYQNLINKYRRLTDESLRLIAEFQKLDRESQKLNHEKNCKHKSISVLTHQMLNRFDRKSDYSSKYAGVKVPCNP